MAHNLTANAIYWKFPDHSISTMDNEIVEFNPGPVPTQTEIDGYIVAVSYTHLTLPTICSV